MTGPFERQVEAVAGDGLVFSSSADAERFIADSPELRAASAFSWHSGGRWHVAVTGKSGRISFITLSGGTSGDYVVGNVPLSRFQG